MALYQYRAAHTDGRIATGRIDALHETDLEAQLKRLDLALLSAKPVAARTLGLGPLVGGQGSPTKCVSRSRSWRVTCVFGGCYIAAVALVRDKGVRCACREIGGVQWARVRFWRAWSLRRALRVCQRS